MEWLTSLTAWITGLIKGLWVDLVNYFNEAWINVSQIVLSSIADTVHAIPSPDFLNDYSMGHLFGYLPSDFLYFISYFNLPECFALIAAGFSFRMVRKVITLFQW
jgi:hypothetical protein